MKIIIKPNSEKRDDKWIPAGSIIFPAGITQTENTEFYYENRFDTKEKADKYFIENSNKKYMIVN